MISVTKSEVHQLLVEQGWQPVAGEAWVYRHAQHTGPRLVSVRIDWEGTLDRAIGAPEALVSFSAFVCEGEHLAPAERFELSREGIRAALSFAEQLSKKKLPAAA